MMWRSSLARLGREVRLLVDELADHVVAHDDLAVQLAHVGHLRRQAVAGVGVRLADVVQQGAGDDEVAVDGVEPRRHARRRLGDDERVLEQAVPVGVVVAHGGRRDGERGAGLARAVEGALEQRTQMRLLDRVDERVQPLGQLGGADRRHRHEVAGVVLAAGHGAQAAHLDLRAVLRVDAVGAADQTTSPALRPSASSDGSKWMAATSPLASRSLSRRYVLPLRSVAVVFSEQV